jgi:hypothetical protein
MVVDFVKSEVLIVEYVAARSLVTHYSDINCAVTQHILQLLSMELVFFYGLTQKGFFFNPHWIAWIDR